MDIVLCLLKTAIVWLVMVLVGANLLGLLVRGLYLPPPPISSDKWQEAGLRGPGLRDNVLAVLFFSTLIVGYFVALWYFWNIGLVGAGATCSGKYGLERK